MKISPNVQIVVGTVVAVLTVLANGTVGLPMGIPPEWGQYFVSWDDFLLKIYAVAAPVMLGFSSSQPGPLAPADPPAVVAAQRVADLPLNTPSATVAAVKNDAIDAIKDHAP